MGREDLVRSKSKGKTNYKELSVPSRNANKNPSATCASLEESKEIQQKSANLLPFN